MLAMSSQLCWLLEDPFIHIQENNINCFSTEKTETSGSIDLQSPSSTTIRFKSNEFVCLNEGFHPGDDSKMVKKLNHNASERDRRKRINSLYSSLRSLLPPEDQSRKLSIPATVSRVVKYIPELQKEVARLIQRKESLMSKISRQDQPSSLGFKNKRRKLIQSPLSAVSATQISHGETIIQSSMPRAEKGSFSEAIQNLELEGFLVVNASCFESFQRRVFYNLHLQAQGNQVMDAEILKEKLWSSWD